MEPRAIGRSSDLQADCSPTCRGFPVPCGTSALLTAFVPVYRCGAVPDSHRIPSCAPGVGPGDR